MTNAVSSRKIQSKVLKQELGDGCRVCRANPPDEFLPSHILDPIEFVFWELGVVDVPGRCNPNVSCDLCSG